jgi:hypothetical protein
MKDPQTGESLGRVETPCCEVVVDRVTPKMSYGHLENVQGSLDGASAGALQIRGLIKSHAETTAAEEKSASSVSVESSQLAKSSATQVTMTDTPTAATISKKAVKRSENAGDPGAGDDKNW